MCVLQNSQTYGGIGNSGCYECQEPDGVARMAQSARASRAKPEIKQGRGSASPSPEIFFFENSNLK